MTAHSIVGAGVGGRALRRWLQRRRRGPADRPRDTTTTVAPTTTLDPVAAEEAAVSEAAVQARLARLNALVNPDDPAAVAALDQYYASRQSGSSGGRPSLAGSSASEGWRVRAASDVPESVTVEEIAFADGHRRPRPS